MGHLNEKTIDAVCGFGSKTNPHYEDPFLVVPSPPPNA